MSSEELVSEAEWEIWYQDLFDRECPRQVEIRGQWLVEGLIELWARHLFETIQSTKPQRFSRFNLWWRQERQSVEIVGEWEGQVRLRGWVFRDTMGTTTSSVEGKEYALLKRVAVTHKNHILRGGTSEEILGLAKSAQSRADFEKQLLDWNRQL